MCFSSLYEKCSDWRMDLGFRAGGNNWTYNLTLLLGIYNISQLKVLLVLHLDLSLPKYPQCIPTTWFSFVIFSRSGCDSVQLRWKGCSVAGERCSRVQVPCHYYHCGSGWGCGEEIGFEMKWKLAVSGRKRKTSSRFRCECLSPARLRAATFRVSGFWDE